MGNFLKKGKRKPVRNYMIRKGSEFLHLVGTTRSGDMHFEYYDSHYGAVIYPFHTALELMKELEQSGDVLEMVDAKYYLDKQKKDTSENAVLISPSPGIFLQFVDATKNEDGVTKHEYQLTPDITKARIFPRIAAQQFVELNNGYEIVDAITAWKTYSGK